MFWKKGVSVMAMILCASMLLGFWGCKKNKKELPTCGGVIDKTNYTAPKQIKSKDICGFYFNCYLDGQSFCFEIKKNSEGQLFASETNSGRCSAATQELFSALQDIVDRHGLAERNGIYKITSGLPPEFQPSRFYALYTSGENIEFTQNNNTDSEWAKEICSAFNSCLEG